MILTALYGVEIMVQHRLGHAGFVFKLNATTQSDLTRRQFQHWYRNLLTNCMLSAVRIFELFEYNEDIYIYDPPWPWHEKL